MNEIPASKLTLFQRPYIVLSGLLLLQLLFFYPTYWGMVEIWWRSETFAHGFFIFPIAAYLIWKKRNQLRYSPVHSDYRALFPLITLGFIWLLAYAVDVIVVKQFAAVLMLPALVWLMLGWQTTSLILFPLAFLLFAVPFGEFLVYPLMKFTAVFTVNAIRAVGIPVFWEGLYFSLPSGSWSVVEACSGFRYILASLTLGALYAYLSYQSFWRRTAFMVLALVVPIVANGLRAFMIVMIGHFSGMELAVGVDHLIYGWVWFGVVMFIMFWIGSFWTDKSTAQVVVDQAGVRPTSKGNTVWAFSLAVAILIIPVCFSSIQNEKSSSLAEVQMPSTVANWQRIDDESLVSWQPIYQGASQEINTLYVSDEKTLGLHIAVFANQQQGEELVNRNHRLIHMKDKNWKEVNRVVRNEEIAGVDIGLVEAQIKSPAQSLLVWQWKHFNGVMTSNDFYLKALEAWAKITGQPQQGAAVIVYTTYDSDTHENLQRASHRLHAFVDDLLPELERQLNVQPQ